MNILNMIKLPLFYDFVLPTAPLPNALPPELGIVNYIHTLYSNKLRSESYFDQDLEKDVNPMNQLFGNALGHWPSSVLMGGTYLSAPCYRHLVKLEFNSVYFGKKYTNRYIYPIKVTLHFNKFTGVDRVGSKLNGEFFWKHISTEVLSDIYSGRAIVFLDWANENFIEKEEFINFHKGLENSGIPKEQIILSINSFNAQELYESWFSPEERRLEVRNLPYLISNISYVYASQPDTHLSIEEFLETQSTIRKNHFVFPSRRARPHRIAMLHKMATDGLLDKGDWSFLNEMNADHGYYESSQVFDINREIIHDLHKMIPHALQSEPGNSYLTTSGWGKLSGEMHKHSYLYIASETYVKGEYKSLTEKVFKPLANFQPFVFIAFPGALAELQKLGFKTFSPFINENYDFEQDYRTRMHMIASEINRILSMPKEEIHNWFWSMKEILIHNQKHLLEIYQDRNITCGLINYLHDRVKKL